ncbi:Asp-tRNA(Asn)/Glu-tRNA(Gln) amidotransferase subunit GatA [Aerococcus urinaeequi]|uniref:Asp-tRNA(Asn)/Glu-tRNA(Gln) amidotransferase subunit GatA n=1 Tax=Aerococcus urinaeequi TaxID=51665 RepID=UPI003AD2F7E8
MEKFTDTIRSLNEKLVAGQVTSVELVEEAIRRIKADNDVINAVITLDEENALAKAKASDEKGYSSDRPLQGIPIGLKDNILTNGVTTTAASKMLADFVPIYDATVTEKLAEAGAINIAKLNMDEFAMGGSNETSYFGPVRNPFDTDRVPGGSSGGSAAAVSAGQVMATLGTDTGGSIRQPAAYNGIVGMKPTYGRVSRWGVISFASSLDQVGPMTRTVEDNAIMLEAIAGYDDHDSTSANIEVPNYVASMKDGVQGLTVGVPVEFFGDSVDEQVKEQVRASIKQLENAGATIKEISFENLKYGIPVYYIIASAEASSNLQRYDGIRYGYRAENFNDLEELYVNTRTEGFGDEVKRRLMTGTFSIASENFDEYFMKAAKVRMLIKEAFDSIFSEVDLIVSPVTTGTAFKLGEKNDDPIEMYMADLLTVPVNLAGLPGLSMPVGFDDKGLPIGLQIIGNRFEEEKIYRAAYAVEQVNDAYTKHPAE